MNAIPRRWPRLSRKPSPPAQSAFPPTGWRDTVPRAACPYPAHTPTRTNSPQSFPRWALPAWGPLAQLSFEERLARLHDPAVRAAVLAETAAIGDPTGGFLQYDMVFSMDDPPRYEPRRDESMAAIAAAEGRPVLDVIYDTMLE